MSNRFKNAIVDDVTSRNINAVLQDDLFDLFESAEPPRSPYRAGRGLSPPWIINSSVSWLPTNVTAAPPFAALLGP